MGNLESSLNYIPSSQHLPHLPYHGINFHLPFFYDPQETFNLHAEMSQKLVKNPNDPKEILNETFNQLNIRDLNYLTNIKNFDWIDLKILRDYCQNDISRFKRKIAEKSKLSKRFGHRRRNRRSRRKKIKSYYK